MIQAQADGEVIWVSGISSEPVDYPVKSVHSPLTPVDIKQAQEKDPSISVLEKKRVWSQEASNTSPQLLPCQSLPIDTTPAELRNKPKCTSSRPITRSKQQNLQVQPEEPDHSSSDEEDEFMSIIPSQAPGDDPETTVPLEETGHQSRFVKLKVFTALKYDC